mgnify:CR=1 FL=1
MDIKIRICDVCGKEARGKDEYTAGENFAKITLSFRDGTETLFNTGPYKYIHMCPDCVRNLGFREKVQEAVREKEKGRNPFLKLCEAISEIVKMAVIDQNYFSNSNSEEEEEG